MRKQIGSIAGMTGLAILALVFAGRERVAYAEDFESGKICSWGPGDVCRVETKQTCARWVSTTVGGGLTGSLTGGGVNGTATLSCGEWVTVTDTYYWTETGTGAGSGTRAALK